MKRTKARLWLPLLTLLAGCAVPGGALFAPVEEKTSEAATRITRIAAGETGQGSRVTIRGNGHLAYQLFRMESPPRLLITFPKVTIEPSVQPAMLTLTGISGIFPMETADGGGKVEIMLTNALEYEVNDLPDGLDLTILTEAKTVESPTVRDLRIQRGEGGTSIQLVGAGNFPTPQMFRLNNPPRLVVDLFGVTGSTPNQRYEVNSPEATLVSVAANPEKIRMVVELADSQVTHALDTSSNPPTIQLSHGLITPERSTAPNAKATPRNATTLEDLKFTREGDNALLRLRMNRSDVIVDSRQESNAILVDLKGITIPTALTRHRDVSAFGGPVESIDSYSEENNGKLVLRLLDPRSKYETMQRGNDLLFRIIPAGGQANTKKETSTYTGERITMDFKDIDIQNALKFITEVSRTNIITSDSVRGTLTMRLEDVPWDQALDLILEAKGLGKTVDGNVMRVATLTEIQTMDSDRLKAQQSQQQLENLITEVISISFANPEEIGKLLSSGDGAARLLSPRGSVTVDKRTSAIIVNETATNLAKIRQMISQLDKAIAQVLIEARIVEVNRNNTMDLGINWGFNYKPSANGQWALSSSALNAYTAQQGPTTAASMSGGVVKNINMLPSSVTPNIGFHLGSVNPLLDLDVELGAAELAGTSKTISSPRVLTIDNQLAKITQGSSIPYSTVSTNGTQTQFVDATLSLEVTPKISPNGFITLDVSASNNQPGSTGSPPPISKKEVKTKVLVKNGETIVLGGIFTNSAGDTEHGIPGLDKIPGLGWLFKNKSTTDVQTELLIFITPRIVNPS